MKFNHLNVPSHWKNYWTRYPEGHTILEALISWVSQVDSMVDHQNNLNANVEQFRNEIDDFVGRFDDRLQTEVTQTLSEWQDSGFLDVVINEALQTQMDDLERETEQALLSFNTQLQQTEQELTTELQQIVNKSGWVDKAFVGNNFIAHRGFSHYYPENTLKAYYEAGKAGFYGWELDPWVSTDGVWFNMHDDTVDRTTDDTGSTESFSISQIKSMEITGGNNANLFPGLKVPTIEEVYVLASKMEHKPYIFLNNRSTTPLNEQRTKDLANIIKRYGFERKTLLFIGNFSSIDGFRNELPEVGVCYDFGGSLPTSSQLDTLATYKPNVMASVLDGVLLENPSVIEDCRSRGILIQSHTVNNYAIVSRLNKLNVNTILTDSIISV